MTAMIDRWVRPVDGPQALGTEVVVHEPGGRFVETTRLSRHDVARTTVYAREEVAIDPSPGLGRLWCLVVAIGVLSLLTLGCGATTAPTCEGSERLRFGDGSNVPLCALQMSIGAVAGRPSLEVSGRLPARGPYGAGQELATFAVSLYRFDGPGEYVARGILNVNPHQGGIFVGVALDWSGTCGLDARADGLGIDCALRSASGDELNVTADLPSAPDPQRAVGLRWLDVTYAFEGDYVAAATVEAAMDVHEDGRIISVPLADGGILTIVPEGREPDGRTWDLALPAQSPAKTQLGIPQWRPSEELPSLGACVVTPSEDPFKGSMQCPGDAASVTGSATLEVSWRVAR
jgi:hypothetical protein